MKRFLKSTAQLLLIWLAIALTLAAGAGLLAVINPLHDVPFVGAMGQA
ncbi:MAG: hypothetical protein ACTHJ9_17175 [Rhodanobacter sp.]